jgi:hypothetical protein
MPRCLCLFLFALASCCARAQDGKIKPLILVDLTGKEIPIKGWSLVSGTKHLSWLAKDGKAKKGAPVGPECLEFRESKIDMYQDDVTTFIPLTALKQLEYDHKAKEVLVTLVGPDGKDATLRGPTRFKGINQFALDGEVGAAAIEIGGSVRILEGSLRVGFKSLTFPDAAPTPALSGPAASVLVRGKEKTLHQVQDLVPLYRVNGAYRVLPALFFQKTVKLELADIAKMTHLAPASKKGGALDFEVEKRDGMKQGLTLLDKSDLGEKETALLVGLVGRAPAGYRLFPAGIIQEVSWRAEEKK